MRTLLPLFKSGGALKMKTASTPPNQFFNKVKLALTRGVLFIMPVWLTAVLVGFVYQISETWLSQAGTQIVLWLLPASWYMHWFPDGHIPGVSLLLAFTLLLATGAVASCPIGKKGLRVIDWFFLSIPGLRSVYASLRKIVDALGEPGKSRFQKVVFVEWPTKGIRTVGFVTNEIPAQADGEKQYVLFVPHMPNPTSGFVVLVDESRVVETQMTPDEGLKYCLSLGVLAPPAVQSENS